MTSWINILEDAAAGNIAEERINPYARTLKFPVLDSREGMTVKCRWQASEEVHQASGMVFGGYLSALSDHAAAYAMLTVLQDNEIFFTKKLEIEYLKPVRKGMVYVVATVISREGITAMVEVTLDNAKGETLAIASVQQTVFAR